MKQQRQQRIRGYNNNDVGMIMMIVIILQVIVLPLFNFNIVVVEGFSLSSSSLSSLSSSLSLESKQHRQQHSLFIPTTTIKPMICHYHHYHCTDKLLSESKTLSSSSSSTQLQMARTTTTSSSSTSTTTETNISKKCNGDHDDVLVIDEKNVKRMKSSKRKKNFKPLIIKLSSCLIITLLTTKVFLHHHQTRLLLTASCGSNSIITNNNKQNNISIQSMLLFSLLRGGSSGSGVSAVAAITTRIKSLFISLLHSLVNNKKSVIINCIKSFISIYIMYSIYQWTRMKQRQSMDITSEWNYYAQHPNVRSRAILFLIVEQCYLILFGSIFGKLFSKGDIKNKLYTIASNKFSTNILKLGPLYIKLGQIISCRPNVLGTKWIKSMEKLQDQVPAKSGQDALELAYSSMEEEEDQNINININTNINTTSTTNEIITPTPATTPTPVNNKRKKKNIFKRIFSSNTYNKVTYTSKQKDIFNDIFLEFDTKPLAAASLGQVHKAILRNEPYKNDIVAVKIQRPFLKQIYNTDLEFLLKLAKIMDLNVTKSITKSIMGKKDREDASNSVDSVSWTSIFLDAKKILLNEIDYIQEGKNARHFANDFRITKGGKELKEMSTKSTSTSSSSSNNNNNILPSAYEWIRTPYIYSNISSERCLIMEYVPSIKITNNKKLLQANITQNDKYMLADSLARAYLRQFCSTKFFSTDPHPGNLGVELINVTSTTTTMKNIRRQPRLVIYDFGQAATLTQNQSDGILDIIEAIIDMDVDKSMIAFTKMGVLTTNDPNELQVVRNKIQQNYQTGKVKANTKKLKRKGYYKNKKDQNDNNNTISKIEKNTTNTTNNNNNDLEVMSYFTLPAEYAFVARAITQMDGVGKTLDPDFDFISNAAPYIVEIKGTETYIKDEISKFFNKLFKIK